MNKYGLLPCPFCGSDTVAILGSTLKFADCRNCGATSDCFTTEQEVVTAWNRRPDDESKKDPD